MKYINFKNVDNKKIENIFKKAQKATLTNRIAFFLIGYLLNDTIGNSLLFTLISIIIIDTIYIFIVIYSYKHIDKKKWILYYSMGVFISSSIWGGGGVLILINSSSPEKYKFLLFATFIGIAASGISTLGFILKTYIMFIIPLLIPPILYFTYNWRNGNFILAILIVIGLIYFIKTASENSNFFSKIISQNDSFLKQKNEIFEQKEKNLKQKQENLKQRELLQQQSKLAIMGEMISSIAHQWRQPLNELSISIQMLEYTSNEELLQEEFIPNFINKNTNTIDFMSKTIDDFRNFFKIDKEKKDFNVKEVIKATISILDAQLKNNNIRLIITGENFILNGFKGEFQQVILNIINNAKDALISKKEKKNESKIEINIEKNIVKIKDNGRGIPKNIIDRIFEPYFTTKEQGNGTGIGLYMSKMIIENSMEGSLSVSNIDNGTEFIIEFKN